MGNFVCPGGTIGTGSGLAPENFTAYTKALWDSYLDGTYTLSQFHDGNGGAVDSVNGATVTDLGGSATISGLDTAKVIAGMTVRVTSATSGSLTTLYEVVGQFGGLVEVKETTVGDGSIGLVDGDTVDCHAGGFAQIDNQTNFKDWIDNIAADVDATNNNVENLLNQDLSVTSEIAWNTLTGDIINGEARLIHVNSSFKDDNVQGTIDATAAIATGIINFTNGIQCIKFKNWIFDGGGAGNAQHAIYNNTDAEGAVGFHNCRITNCVSDGLFLGGTLDSDETWAFYGTEIDSNGGWAIKPRATSRGNIIMQNCDINNNTLGGVQYGQPSAFENNVIWNNGGIGLEATSVGTNKLIIKNNTINNNTGDAIKLFAGIKGVVVTNNITSNNTGYGYNLVGLSLASFGEFSHNLSYGDTDYSSEATVLARFQDLGNGCNLTGDPLYVDASNGDLRLKPGSAAIAEGLSDDNLGARSFNDVPEIANILDTDTINDISGLASEGGGLLAANKRGNKQ